MSPAVKVVTKRLAADFYKLSSSELPGPSTHGPAKVLSDTHPRTGSYYVR